jgi:hypothetical protein
MEYSEVALAMQKSAEPYFNGVNKIRELQNDILHR